MPQRVLSPCSTCNGTGSVRSQKCEPCDGQGEVLVCPPFKKCLSCNGSGRGQNRDWTLTSFCTACQGRGWALSSAITPAT